MPVPEWVEEFEKRFGLRVVELYGSVEASIPVTQDLQRPRVPGSCGRVTEGFEVRIHDDADEPVAPGTPGELVIRPARASTILDGYFGMPEATAEAFRNLWFHSGDTARIDDDGNVFFIGRRKDAIRRRGENISAFEVEEGILLHPDVLECAAVGVPSELTEEEVKVVVVARPGSELTPEAVLAHAERTLARFQVPRFIEFADALPKTPTGKIAKHLLEPGPTVWDRELAVGVVSRWATFDCYGTLVDWEAGMRGALGDDALLAGLSRGRTRVQVGAVPALSRGARARACGAPPSAAAWRSTTSTCWRARCRTGRCTPTSGPALGGLLADGWRLAILSNVDRDLIAGTLERLRVPFEIVITAEDVRAYKPDLAHFRAFAERPRSGRRGCTSPAACDMTSRRPPRSACRASTSHAATSCPAPTRARIASLPCLRALPETLAQLS